jgi:xanthine dehydrogenase/oxidase
MLRWFASSQIRNVACLGGNLVTASPISDMNPVLASLNAKLILASLADDKLGISRRSVPVKDFFLRYRAVDLHSTELVERIEIPILRDVLEYMNVFKQARRREDDISIVTSGMRIRLVPKDGNIYIEDIALAFGGMAPKTVMASATMEAMIGAEFCKETFDNACKSLLREFALPEAVPGGQAAFRMTLAASFLYKFFLFATESLKTDLDRIKANPKLCPLLQDQTAPALDEREKSGLFNFVTSKKPSTSGVQTYPTPKVAQGLEEKRLPEVKEAEAAKNAVVGEAHPHMSGQLHCTGEALYTDDIPLPPGSLQAALILSNQCGSILKKIDKKSVLALSGVVGVYTYEDLKSIGGDNTMGPIVHDELVFLPVGEKVRTVGQVLGVVVAETLESAELGARTVVVEYDDPKGKIIVTVEDAISHNSFYDFSRHTLERGDGTVIEALASMPDSGATPSLGDIVKVSGTFRSGAQEHFYLETNSTLVIPSESDTNLTVYCSTQAPTKTQTFVASSTGTPASKVVVRMKRMGGGFGGKETRSVFASCAAAVAAKISGRPVRLTLSRDVDMSITGTRHAFVSKYHASAVMTESGAKLQALDIQLYANAGCGFDLSGPVVDRALFHVDGCYYFPNFRAVGVACKTVQAPHTAFRGFGGPQVTLGRMIRCRSIVSHVARHLVAVGNGCL